MPNLSKRIEALERIGLAMRQERREIVERAFLRLSYKDLSLIADAFYADRAGRAPTEEQSAALQSLTAAVAQERHGALPQLAAREWTLDSWDILYVNELILDCLIASARARPGKLKSIDVDFFVSLAKQYPSYSPEGADGKEFSYGTTGPAIPTGQ